MSFPPHTSYKPSGYDWLGDIPFGWRVQKFRHLFRESSEKIESEVFGEMLSVSGYRGIERKEYDDENRRRRDEDLIGYRIVRRGQLVVNTMWLNYAGLGFTDLDGHVSPAYRAYWPRTDESARYLHYLLRSEFYVKGYTRLLTGVRPNSLQMSRDNMMSFPVISHAVTKGLNPNAPMKDSGVEWLGEVPEHWGVAQLKHVSKSLPGFAFPSERFSQDDSKWRLLRGVNVGVACIRWDETVYWDREADDRLDQYVLEPGDLVVGLDRPMIKEGLRVARVSLDDCPCMLLQRVAAVKGTASISTDYLFYLLSSALFAAHFEPETTGVSVPHISTKQIDSFVVPIPPMEEQNAALDFLAEELDGARRLIQESEKSIELLQERRSALISAAVTGQIDVRELVTEAVGQ